MTPKKYPALRAVAAAITIAMGVFACAGTSYNLPPVGESTAGERLPGKFIWHDLISDDPAGSEAFYADLFGWEFNALPLSGASYWLISLHGEPIGGMVRQQGIPAQKDISQWVSAIAVDDVAAVTATVRRAGGTVLREPVSLGDRGDIAVFADQLGAIFATLQTRDGDPVDEDQLPAVGAFLWHELWTADVDAAASFYSTLTGLMVEDRGGKAVDGASIDYRILRDGRVPRGGLRGLPEADMPTLWMPYLRVADEAELSDIVARVPALNGQVLIPIVARPAGGHVAVIAGPSGAPMALQTWSDTQPKLEDL